MSNQFSNQKAFRFPSQRFFFALTLLSFLICSPHVALSQDSTGPVDWSQADWFDADDPSRPFYWEPDPTIIHVGNVTSQADVVMNADTARNNFGVNGSGIKIGVISDSYNVLGGEAAGIASGDLPGIGNTEGFFTPVTIVKDDTNGTDEGRAMIELIHDLAPGAELLFHSAFNNGNAPGAPPSTTIADAIDALRLAGADIIVDDVGILTAAKYQDGAAAQAVDRAFAAGVPYFSSAGNNDNNAYEGTQVGNGAVVGNGFDFNDIHDFKIDPAQTDTILNLGAIAPGATFRATLWWDDPYASLGGATTTDMSLAIVVLDANGNPVQVFESDQDQQAGADPFEFTGITNTGAVPVEIGVVVDRIAGPEAKLISIEVDGLTISDDDDTDSPTIHGHNAAKGAVAVAAQFYNDPGLDEVEPFSSEGPSLILFDVDGNRLANPEFRATPQITGIDGTDTTFFIAGLDPDNTGFPNFFGTSAAAPHVAAVAALMLDRAEDLGLDLSPEEIYDLLFASTVDIEAPGFDNLSGFGRLDAQLALSQVQIPEPGTVTLLALTLGLCTIARRRH